MKFLILGDLHGAWQSTNVVIARAINAHPDITHIVQLGDFAYGWPRTKPFKASRGFLDDYQMQVYHLAEKLWIDGNHENFDKLEQDGGAWQPGWTYMPRGSVLEIQGYRIMFFGGASSIDKSTRIEGVSWWPQESIRYKEVADVLEKENGQIDAIFSHEHPTAFPYSDSRYDNEIFGKGDKDMLEALRQKYRPPHWFFGHHHSPDSGQVEETRWFCCPIIDSLKYTVWDGYSVQTTW